MSREKLTLHVFRKPVRIEDLPFECAACGEILEAWKKQHKGEKPICWNCYGSVNPRNAWGANISWTDNTALSNANAAIKLLENACAR